MDGRLTPAVPTGMHHPQEVTQGFFDAFSNAITGLGGHNSKTIGNAWSIQYGQSREVLQNFYRFNGLCRNIVDREPVDAMRRKFLVQADAIGPEEQRSISKWLRRRKFFSGFVQAVKWERLFGGALLYQKIDDGGSESDPVNENKIRNIGFVTPLSRYDVSIPSFVNDPITGEMAVPELYQVVHTGQIIHPSRVIRFPGLPLTIDEMIENEGWGGSVVDLIWSSLVRYGTTQDYSAEGLTRITQGVLTTPHLQAVRTSDEAMKRMFEARMDALGKWLGLLGDIVLGEGETYEIKQRGFQGIRDIGEMAVDDLCATVKTPRSILFGKVAGGLNTGENSGDWQSWTGHLSGKQSDDYEPLIEPFIDRMFRSGNSPLSAIPEVWDIEWPSLYEPPMVEKSTAMANTASAASILEQMGVLSREEIRTNDLIQSSFSLSDDPVGSDEPEFGDPDVDLDDPAQGQSEGRSLEVIEGGQSQ